ncbi:hypothetical protein HPB52_017990 [Rhipicephalus sanguineus]|uniref:Uncharacterized protein n=1 Tax=Rhipicephalus sanguineus TaxID=34632 RepID=A0A9D4SP80_RHISA|nr:hypothetical protein HPB52_017990 [Rhipicephalus sanguineus]
MEKQPSKSPNVRDSRVPDEESSEDHFSVYDDVAIAIAIVVAAGVLLGSLMLRSKSRSLAQQLFLQTGTSSFCCPDKVRELVRYVNSTLEPCENFFDYVCSNNVYSRFETDTTVDSSLERFVATGVPPENHGRGGEVAVFMIGYFRSCVASLGRRDSFASQMTQSILRVAQDVLRHPNGRNSFQFMVEMSVRYMIPSVLEITYNPWDTTLRIQVRAQCEVSLMSADCLSASVKAVRSAMNPSVNISNTEKFMAELCRRFPAALQNSTYVWFNATDAISTQLWDARDVKAAMSVVGYGATNTTVIEAFGLLQIRAIHDAFAMQGNCWSQGSVPLVAQCLRGRFGLPAYYYAVVHGRVRSLHEQGPVRRRRPMAAAERRGDNAAPSGRPGDRHVRRRQASRAARRRVELAVRRRRRRGALAKPDRRSRRRDSNNGRTHAASPQKSHARSTLSPRTSFV